MCNSIRKLLIQIARLIKLISWVEITTLWFESAQRVKRKLSLLGYKKKFERIIITILPLHKKWRTGRVTTSPSVVLDLVLVLPKLINHTLLSFHQHFIFNFYHHQQREGKKKEGKVAKISRRIGARSLHLQCRAVQKRNLNSFLSF